ncbi:carbohydrate ABC transporter permease [Egibacter rhizosphaerae]|uniref:Carbohydrate ABC transporter permease n=1 Tax=Egibacter rhizosphaerae TaxID=1670831 RepID=A0A411YAX0_9ACTN|nr:carbohydrate ABC transporter permease [Egibacter rhizosphaerae]QBI18354.1 carbohydrate ABC transporter permease [Egibacter rhizosphaerae]
MTDRHLDEQHEASTPSASKAAAGLGGKERRRRQQLIATAIMSLVALAFLIPLYWLVISAVRAPDRIFADAGDLFPSTFTLQNFAALFEETLIISWFTNSVILAAGSTIGSLIVVTMAAYPLARMQFRGRNVLFIGVLASHMLPFHLLLIPLFVLMVDLNLMDTHLGVIVPLLAHPFGLFYMRQYMLGLPQDLLDAARVDGASEYQIFLRVVVPMVKPALATLAVLFALEQWNDLLWPLIVMRSEDNFPLSVGISSLIGLYRPRWDLVLTASFLSVLPVALLFMKLRNVFISGLGRLGTGGK